MIHSHSATVRCGTRSFAARASFPCVSRRRRARARRAGQAAGPVLIGLKGGALRAKLADIMAVPPPPPPSLTHPPAHSLAHCQPAQFPCHAETRQQPARWWRRGRRLAAG